MIVGRLLIFIFILVFLQLFTVSTENKFFLADKSTHSHFVNIQPDFDDKEMDTKLNYQSLSQTYADSDDIDLLFDE
jgi:hypothetical protein